MVRSPDTTTITLIPTLETYAAVLSFEALTAIPIV